MNVLSDFTLRLNNLVPINENELEMTKLKMVIDEKSKKLEEAELELKKLRKTSLVTAKPKVKPAKKTVEKPKSVKKTASK
jgi:hypothetical protein